MPDAFAGGVEHDALLTSEVLDGLVLGEIGLAGVLNVVIEREDRLRGIRHRVGPDGSELGQNGAGVVVGHDVKGPDGDDVAGSHLVAVGKIDRVGLRYFFGDRLRHVFNSKENRKSKI